MPWGIKPEADCGCSSNRGYDAFESPNLLCIASDLASTRRWLASKFFVMFKRIWCTLQHDYQINAQAWIVIAKIDLTAMQFRNCLDQR